MAVRSVVGPDGNPDHHEGHTISMIQSHHMETVLCHECHTELYLPLETLVDLEIENRMHQMENMGFLCESCEAKILDD